MMEQERIPRVPTGESPTRVAAFTGGANVPSARFRVRQYIPALACSGVAVSEFSSRLGTYPPVSRTLRPFWAIGTCGNRLPDIVRSYRYDVTLLQREMLSTFVTLEPLTRAPRVLDVDDAIWLLGGDALGSKLARICDMVICGNAFLAEHFSRWNPNIAILPTAVDTDRYTPLPGDAVWRRPIVGWTGSSPDLAYLYDIEGALQHVLEEHPDVTLRVVCDRKPHFQRIPAGRVEFVPWSLETEVRAVQEMTVGLMPLADSLWTRGKCSYKMLLYMACGVPVAVSPIGMNSEVLRLGDLGYGASSAEEWYEGICSLLQHPDQALAKGNSGRQVAVTNYSIQVLAPRLAELLRSIAA